MPIVSSQFAPANWLACVAEGPLFACPFSAFLFRKKVEGRRLFRYSDNGKVDALIDRRNNEDLVWKKIK